MFNIAYFSNISFKLPFDGGVIQQNTEIYFTLIRLVIVTYLLVCLIERNGAKPLNKTHEFIGIWHPSSEWFGML